MSGRWRRFRGLFGPDPRRDVEDELSFHIEMRIIGGAIGLASAMLLGRAAQTLLFGLQFDDPVVLASSIVALTLVALAAGLVPADRAARVDPMSALKYE